MFFIHLRSCNVCHFGLFEAAGLRSMALRSPQWHDLPAEFQENLPVLKVIGGHTAGQTAWW
jgi:hypothetical protein